MEKMINLFDVSDWQEAREYSAGTRKKLLHDENGVKTILLNLPEGFHMAPHSHIFTEQHIIMKGEYISEGKVYHEGTYRSFKAHESHGPFESRKGAMVLVIWSTSQSDK
jgi:anti-sigma factor ChrR (cupin superfamily)